MLGGKVGQVRSEDASRTNTCLKQTSPVTLMLGCQRRVRQRTSGGYRKPEEKGEGEERRAGGEG